MGFWDAPSYDFDGDGNESANETRWARQRMAKSREEAIRLTGDDYYYVGSDPEFTEEQKRRIRNGERP